MAQDIAPILNEQIQVSFKNYCLKDRRITQISKRIRDGTATFKDAHDYAEHLGENLSKALVNNLTAENLPNGKLYYNIANRTVTPGLEENYNLVNDISAEIQKAIDKKAKIGLGSVRAEFPKERIQGLIDKMTADDLELEDALKWLREPIVNNSEAFVDDYIKTNANFRSETGLKTKIIRKADPNCCKWCADLEGEYDYDSAPDDIYRRHEFCRCTVTYQSSKTSQNVWSKRSWTTKSEDLEQRKSAGTGSKMTTQERLSQIENVERDKVIKDYVNQTGYQRTTARQSTLRKSPQEIAKEIAKIKERQNNIRG